jgi:hypothetical protein
VTVGEALALARAAGLERLDARLLLAHALGWPPARVVAHDEATLERQPKRPSATTSRAGPTAFPWPSSSARRSSSAWTSR